MHTAELRTWSQLGQMHMNPVDFSTQENSEPSGKQYSQAILLWALLVPGWPQFEQCGDFMLVEAAMVSTSSLAFSKSGKLPLLIWRNLYR